VPPSDLADMTKYNTANWY